MPKISIIVPNYNHSKFLTNRLDSIINQTFKSFEIILLDDSSKDKSLDILVTYATHLKVSHFIVNNQNSGSPFKQWQKGLELAKGELIWIAESDDIADITFLENLIPIFSDKEVMLAYCNSYNLDENDVISEIKWNTELSKLHWNDSYVNSGNDEINNYLKYKNTIFNASAVVFRRQRYFDVGCVETNLSYSADWLLWSMIIKDHKIAYINKSLNYFRSHSASTRVVKSFTEEKKRLLENIYIIESIIKNNDFNKNFFDYLKWNSIFSNFINKNDTILSKNVLLFFPSIDTNFIIVYYLKLFFNILKRIISFIFNLYKY